MRIIALLLAATCAAQEPQLAALRAAIVAAEKRVAEARAAAKEEFIVWSDKLPEGPNELKPERVLAEFPFDDLTSVNVQAQPALVDSARGKALLLNGENGVRIPDLAHFTRSDPFTFSLWIRVPGVLERAVVLHHSNALAGKGIRGYELLLERGRITFALNHSSQGESAKIATQTPLAAERWTHVAVTYDGSSRAAGMRIFVDGIAAPTDTLCDALSQDITSDGVEPDLVIGYRAGDAGFKGGQVDEFRIFARSLAPVEVASLAGLDLFTKAVQSIPELAPEQRDALTEYYIATAHQPSLEARNELHAARDAERRFLNTNPAVPSR